MSTHLPTETVGLADGTRMPMLGLGTWRLRGSTATDARPIDL